MRGRLSRTLALPITAAVLVLSSAPALAQEPSIPTTPVPQPGMPGQPPISSPPQPQPLGRAVGDAGTGLGVLRLLPDAVTTGTILPGYGEQLPKQAVFEGGMGLSSAQANSEAYLSYERAIAESSPFGFAIGGNSPRVPGSLAQTALPDNPEPLTGGLNPPPNPLDALVKLGLLNGRVHARYSETEGPCVAPISDAYTELASLSLLNVIPTLPGADQLTAASPQLKETLGKLPGPLAQFGGLLAGGPQPNANGTGSLVSLPNLMSSRSTVRLVDIPGTDRKAVESTSTMQAARVDILKGTPLELTIKVVSQPMLRATSTGKRETSKVEYTAPVLTIERQGQVLYTLDAAHPTKDIPIGIPLPELKSVPGFENVKDIPVVGGLAELATGGTKAITGNPEATGRVIDLGVLRLSIAQLNQKSMDMTDPFKGFQLGGSARMLDLQLLPTKALKDAMPKELADKLPSSLAQVSLGEQIARAYAPEGGVQCGHTTPPPGGGQQGGGVPKQLAQTAAAYSAVPMFWTGTALLLAGVVLVSALPGRRRPAEEPVRKPSPRPRD